MCAHFTDHLNSRPHQARHRGFTMVELVVVIIILGIVSIFVAPRVDLGLGLREDAWRDQMVAAIRYARQTAVSHRRLVCLTVGTDSVTLRIASANPATACDTDLPGPDGSAVFADGVGTGDGNTVTPGGTIYFQTDGRVTNDGAGTVVSGRTIRIDGSADNAIDILGETGYVD